MGVDKWEKDRNFIYTLKKHALFSAENTALLVAVATVQSFCSAYIKLLLKRGGEMNTKRSEC